MRTLIVHPNDRTTDFLAQIYAPISKKTIITGGVTRDELRIIIESHDRIFIMGHGSSCGLSNFGQFPDVSPFIIDHTMSKILMDKSNIFIWCNSDQFVSWLGLTGLNSGMFISELGEAKFFGFDHIDTKMIDESNARFAKILSKYIEEPIESMYINLLTEYEKEARDNPIALFNLQRLHLSFSGIDLSPTIRIPEEC